MNTIYLGLLLLSQRSEQYVTGRNKSDLYSLVTSAQSTPVRVRIARSPQFDVTANSEYSDPDYYEEYSEEYYEEQSQNQEEDDPVLNATDKIAGDNFALILNNHNAKSTNSEDKNSETPNKPESKADDLPQYTNTPYPIEQLEGISAITNDGLESSTSADKDLQVFMNTEHLGYPVDDEILENLGASQYDKKAESMKLEELRKLSLSYSSEPLEKNTGAISNERLVSSTSANKDLQVFMNTEHLGYPVDDEILEKLGADQFDKKTESMKLEELRKLSLSYPSEPLEKNTEAINNERLESSTSADKDLQVFMNTEHLAYPVVDEILENLGLGQFDKKTESMKLEELRKSTLSYPSESLEKNKAFKVSDSKTEAGFGHSVPQLSPTQFSSPQLPSTQAPNIKLSVQSGIGDSILIKVDGLRETLAKLVSEVIAKLNWSQLNQSDENAQTRQIGEYNDGNVDRVQTESTTPRKFIPDYPVESPEVNSNKEIDGERTSSKSAESVKQVGIAKNGKEKQLETRSFYIPSVRSFFKTAFHNEIVRNVSVTVATGCYNKYAKFSDILRTARIDLINCNGKRIVEGFDKNVEEINSFLPKVKGMIWDLFACDSQTCVDIIVDQLSTVLDAYQEVSKSKEEQFVKIYKNEDDDVRDCAYQVHRKFLYDIHQTRILISECLTTQDPNITKPAHRETEKLVEVTLRDYQQIFYSTINIVFSVFHWITNSNI